MNKEETDWVKQRLRGREAWEDYPLKIEGPRVQGRKEGPEAREVSA